MRASRQFVPTSMAALEGRLVLSVVAPTTGAYAAELRRFPVHLSPAEIARSNASDVPFGLSTSDSIHAGFPVAEQRTTTYIDGSTQTESLLTVPNSANNTTATYKTINPRNNGGIETVVDTESFSGGAQPFSGNANTHTVTITLPNGSTETETEHEVITGHKTVVNGTLQEANGGIQTWTSVQTRTGPKTTANKTITEPDGTVEKQKIVTTKQGDLDSTTLTKTVIPSKDAILWSSSATNVTRVQPPST